MLQSFIASLKACAAAYCMRCESWIPAHCGTSIESERSWKVCTCLSDNIVRQLSVKPHSGADCWRQRLRFKTLVRIVTVRFANLGDLDVISQSGSSRWHFVNRNY